MVHPSNPAETVSVALEALQYPDELLDRRFRARPQDEGIRGLPEDVIGELLNRSMIQRASFDHS